MPAHDIMQQSEFVYYEADERGLRVMLGEKDSSGRNEYVQFSQSPNKPWLAQIKINNKDEDGNLTPIDDNWKLVRKLEQTKHYLRGWVRYVPSPEELRHREKINRQNTACDQLREDLKHELLILPLDTMKPDQLAVLADRIGAPLKDRSGVVYKIDGLRRSIAIRLGLNNGAPEPAVTTNVAEVEPPKPEPRAMTFSDIGERPTPKRRTVKKRGK